MDRLAVMRTLSVVARSTSFSAAALDLGISPSLVSRHIADLEAQVGVRLVNRTPRSLALTSEGITYAQFCERILREIEDADERLAPSPDTVEGHLSIISPKWIGLMNLGLAIGTFIDAHPRMRVHFELGGISDRPYDFIDRGFDVAFHARAPRDSRVLVRRITELPFVLAASAEYLRRRGAPRAVSDLAGHDVIAHVNDTTWRLRDGAQTTAVRVPEPVVTTNAYLIIQQLVESGRGIGLIPRLSARRALASGAVVEVLPQLPAEPRSLFATHGPGGQTPERVRVFLDFMSGWFRTRSLE